MSLALLAGPAAAKRGYLVLPPSIEVTASLQGSNGYRLHLSAEVGKPLKVVAERGDSAVKYNVPARVTRDRIKANLGRLGRVSLRFTPAKVSRFKPKTCKGRRQLAKVGHFDGLIRFQGELGYTSASARKVSGKVAQNFRLVCKIPPFLSRDDRRPLAKPAEQNRLLFTAIAAVSRTHGKALVFGGVELELDKGESLAVSAVKLAEKRGRISILRELILIQDGGLIASSPLGQQPVTAEVKAPKPFHGVGSYLAETGKPPSWTGTISVSLPGAGVIPLAGPRFEVGFCAGVFGSTKTRPCLRKIRRLVTSVELNSARPSAAGRELTHLLSILG